MESKRSFWNIFTRGNKSDLPTPVSIPDAAPSSAPQISWRELHNQALIEAESHPQSDKCDDTSMARANKTIRILTEFRADLPSIPNVLIVGLGYSTNDLQISINVHRIAAHLQEQHLDYKMTLVDYDPKIIQDVQERKFLYCIQKLYTEDTEDGINNAWQKYLGDADVKEEVVHSHQPQLTFASYYSDNQDDFYSTERIFKKGIRKAPVSEIFLQKMAKNEIIFICDDIATADLDQSEPHDYVEIINLLYLLPAPKQQLALNNIISHLKVGGLILLDDISYFGINPLFAEKNGWFTSAIAKEMGLEFIRDMNHESRLYKKFI
ncbi:MAG: hypothetical protein ABI758_01180 [Candidatus Woesebacteria bacterium]